jgi:hypothetical protein
MAIRNTTQIQSDTIKIKRNLFKDVQNISIIQSKQVNACAINDTQIRLNKAYTIVYVLDNPYSTDTQKSHAIDLAAEIGYLTPVNDSYWSSGYSVSGYN